jgi:L-ribulose-5-phosphate 4-epimerase
VSTGTVHVELRTRALEANLALVRAGLVVLTFGNASEADRDAGLMAIKPSGVPYDALDAAAMVLVDLATGETVDSRHRPSSDTATHVVLYRSFDGAGGVAHTHSPWATAWAQARRELPCFGTTHADHFHGPVPVTRPLTSEELGPRYEAATGEVIVEAVSASGADPLDVPAALVCSHGPFTWGVDAAHAVENAVALEAIAAMGHHTLQIAADTGAVEDGLRDRHFRRKHGPTATYGQDR